MENMETPLDKAYSDICAFCDPSSSIPHIMRTSMLRVANLCCIQEDMLIKSTLKDVKGIESIDVNVVGKYAIVKHCSSSCCAPTTLILKKLNEKRLGVSIRDVDTGDNSDENAKSWWDTLINMDIEVVQCVVVIILFIVGIVLQFKPNAEDSEVAATVVYLLCISLGIIPITISCAITIYKYRSLDIKLLMILASAGSIALDDYLDSALVVSLFLVAGVVEKYIKLYVSDAVSMTGGGE